MNYIYRFILFLAFLCLITGCSVTSYDWNGYDTMLYQHYRDPTKHQEFTEKLQEAVGDAENSNRVPPGLYAEYGYLLYEGGAYQTAIDYFRKEKNLWPESHVFMDKMINNASKMMARN